MGSAAEMVFQDSIAEPSQPKLEPTYSGKLPQPIIQMSEDQQTALQAHLDEWLQDMLSAQSEKQKQWRTYEDAYRAHPEAFKTEPFEGACNEVVPAIAMAVDPVHARLETGIWKNEPVFVFKALKRSVVPYIDALDRWVDYYQKHKLKFRQISSPRMLEFCKLGTMVFKTIYDREYYPLKTYDFEDDFKVVKKDVTVFSGPRVFGISLGDFLIPPGYQSVRDTPICGERIRTTIGELRKAEKSGKITNVDKVTTATVTGTDLELAREDAAKHRRVALRRDEVEVFELWFDYDIDDDGVPERLVCLYHYDTHTVLQLRYNWYFHQRKPYTAIPYMVSNESIYGIGLCEMGLPFQLALTRWHQMASDNAYLANIRMFIVKKNSGIEETPRLYTGRVFTVDDPTKDFIPFRSGDTYPSTLQERQNLFGLLEKRTGISDYLTGRESPIIGSRATATSTLALLQEGTRRVEEVLENIRIGFSEIMENCIDIWIQFGLDGVDEVVFGNDEVGAKIKQFFNEARPEQVNGALGVDLAATDAGTGRNQMQQMQLQLINIMMQYLEKLLAAGEGALMAIQQGVPEYAEMVSEVMRSAKLMFTELLQKYEIRNPEQYLPDLEAHIERARAQAAAVAGAGGGAEGSPGGAGGASGVPGNGSIPGGPAPSGPARPGSGGVPGAIPIAGPAARP